VVRAEDGKAVASGIAQSQHTTPLVMDDAVYFAERPVRAVRMAVNHYGEGLWEGGALGEVFGSPLLHDGVLFITTGQGELFAFDTRSKEPQNPIIEGQALFAEDEGAIPITYSSLTLAGKYLFLDSNKGEMVVLEATREAKLISTNSLPGGTGASPVFSGKDMFVRAGERLLCIGE
jgi:outer membrane protein assembly factor BamB